MRLLISDGNLNQKISKNMALKTSTGYVRIVDVSLGSDQKTLTVSWLTFHNDNWRENNPRRVWQGIVENGMCTFDLAIREKQMVQIQSPYKDEQGNLITEEEQEVIIGYKPQSIEQAHEELRNLSGKDCNFKAVNWNVII